MLSYEKQAGDLTSNLTSPGNILSFQRAFNNRLMTLQHSFAITKCAKLISAYAPTMTIPDDIKDKLFEDADAFMSAVPQ